MHFTSLGSAALLAAASLIVVGGATTAGAAAADCYHDACTDKGPVSQGCDHTGSKIASRQVWLPSGNYGTVQLMWSTGCHSFWARGQSVNTGQEGNGNGNYWVRVTRRNLSTQNVTYQHKAHVRSDDGGSWNWTNMAGGTTTSETRACGKPEDTGSWVCTSWFQDSHSSCTTAAAAPGAQGAARAVRLDTAQLVPIC